MRKATFYHAGCPVCVTAENTIVDSLDRSRFDVEIVHLGETSWPNCRSGSRRSQIRAGPGARQHRPAHRSWSGPVGAELATFRRRQHTLPSRQGVFVARQLRRSECAPD